MIKMFGRFNMKRLILAIAQGIAALVLTIGAFTFFKACDGMDGKYMACHWAQNAVVLIGTVLTVLALARIVIPDDKIKTGLSIGIFALSVSAIFIPETAISLCMMKDMACHTTFKPAVIVVSAVLALIALIDVIAGFVGKKKAK